MGILKRVVTRANRIRSAAAVVSVVLLAAAAMPAFAMQLPRPGEMEQLKASGDFENRRKFAEDIGNNRIDPELVKKAVNKAKRKALEQQGFAPGDVDQMTGTYAPPPAWSGVPTTGNVKIFALLIDFNEYPAVTSLADVHNMLFGAGNASDAPYESLAAYYSRSSYGLLDFSGGATLGWYRAGNRSAVVQTPAGRDNLIKNALNYYNAQGHDFSQYDNNGDGKIDYFLVIWTGDAGAWASFWWGYQTSFSDPGYVLDGKTLGKYSWQWEGSPYGQQFKPLVTIHETGHALGLPDYYDYNEATGPKGGVGGLDVMDHTWGDHSAFNKWVLDWISPTVVASGSRTITLNPTATSPEAVLIMPAISSGDLFDEYFMVQNRHRTGNDSGIPNDGLLIWHVDATLNAYGTNYVYNNSDSSHKLLRLMEADGLEEIEKNLSYNGADAGDFYVPGKTFGTATLPSSKSYGGLNTGVTVANITRSGSQVTATYSINIAAPSGTVKINGGATACNTTSVALTVAASGTAANPVTQMRFSNDDVNWSAWEAYKTTKSWSLPGGDGVKTVYVQFRNNVGVDSVSLSATIELDTVVPRAVVVANGPFGGVIKASTFGFSVSGVAGYKFKIDAGIWSAEKPGTTAMSITGVTTGTHTVAVIGKDAAGNWQSVSAPTTLSWTADVTPPATTASPAGGIYVGAQTVTLSPSETATIYYTTNGAAPTTASPVYTAPITVTPPATLKYFAIDAVGNKEAVKTQIYAVPAGVKLSGVPAALTKLTSATISVAGTYVTYKYIFDGGTESGEIPITTKIAKTGLAAGSHTLSVRGKTSAGVWQTAPTAAAWTIDLAVPVTAASPVGGTYSASQSVTLSANEAATIYYTTNGTTPTVSSPKYTGTISVSNTATIKYFAKDAAGNIEAVKSQTYNFPPVVALSGVPASQTKLASALITVSGAGVSSYQYSLDGGTTWSAETPVSIKISLSGLTSGLKTLQVKGKNGATGVWQASPSTAAWTVDTVKPVTSASLASGTYGAAQTVTLSASETADIYYTVTGATPTKASPKYTGPIAINATTTLKFFAVDTAGNIETVQSRLYNLPLAAVITAGAPAVLTKVTSVSLTVGGAGIIAYKYTLDEGAQSAEIPISTKIAKTGLAAGAHTVTVYGKNGAGTWQSIPTTLTWTIDLAKPVTTTSLLAGTYSSPQTVTLSANEAAAIYYTTTGVAPTMASPKYTGPVTITTTTTLKYFAIDTAGNAEAVKSIIYAFPPTAIISGIPSGTTAATTATFSVSGDLVTAYKFKLDNGAWSAEIPVAQARSFVGLESGTHALYVIGRNAGGTWQNMVSATSVVWTVQ